MSHIHITRSHHKSRAQVRADVSGLAETLAQQLDAEFAWEDDILAFRRKGAAGRIVVDDNQIDIQVTLATMFKPLRGKVEETINAYLDEYVAD